MKDVAFYQGREQTYLKHLFLDRYLETVAYHIGYSQQEFVYVDCFSGPWRAADESVGDTSICISLEKLDAVRTGLVVHKRYPTVRAIFVEKSKSAFSSLRQLLCERSGDVKTTALPGKFEENIDRVLAEIGSTFAFFFVDPAGWTGFAMENLRRILRRPRCEVMINFLYDPINRFLNFDDPANERSLDLLFGTPTWRPIRNSPNREAALVDLYVDQVRETGGFEYATSTRILKPLQERAYFHLVYATRSPKGVEKFREIERKVVAEQQSVREALQRQRRQQRSGQLEISFNGPSALGNVERDERLQQAESRLVAILQAGPIKYEALQPRVLEVPLVCRRDLNAILLQGVRTGRFVIEGLMPRDRSPKAGCMIRLAVA